MSLFINWLSASQHYFQQLDWLGVFAFAGIEILVQLTMSPLAPLAIAAGLFFGMQRGLVAVEIGTTGGIIINFLIARYVARDAFVRWLSKHEKFRLIDSAIGKEGGKIVLLLRLCPIPFGLSNFCYGLTAVRFTPYVLASVVGIIPGNILFTWMGATAHASLSDMVAHHKHNPFEYALTGLAIVAFFFALMYISKIARAAVANHSDASPVAEIPAADVKAEAVEAALK